MAARAVSLASAVLASSRSQTGASAGEARDFSGARGFEPGMNRTLRRGRIGAGIARFLLGSRLLADISWRDPIGRVSTAPPRDRCNPRTHRRTGWAGSIGPGLASGPSLWCSAYSRLPAVISRALAAGPGV